MTDYPDQFDQAFLNYARRALEMAGIETDSQLQESKPVLHSIAHAISETGHLYRAARQLCAQSRPLIQTIDPNGPRAILASMNFPGALRIS